MKVAQHREKYIGGEWQRAQEGGICVSIFHVWFEATPGCNPQVPLFCIQSSWGAVAWIGWAQESSTIAIQSSKASKGTGWFAILIDQRVVIPVAFVEVGVLIDTAGGKTGCQVRQGFGI